MGQIREMDIKLIFRFRRGADTKGAEDELAHILKAFLTSRGYEYVDVELEGTSYETGDCRD